MGKPQWFVKFIAVADANNKAITGANFISNLKINY
jgi:hypothetical protein